MNYDEQFVEYMNRCVPLPTEFELSPGWSVMSERFSCPYCREALWLIAGSDGLVRKMQSFGWFGYPQIVDLHTDAICAQLCQDMAAVREYEQWAAELGRGEDAA